MKKRTWIVSALMYALILAACFGVLHVLDKWSQPSSVRPSHAAETASEKETSSGEENAEGAGQEEEETEDGGKDEHAGEEKEAEDFLRREGGYRGWEARIEGGWTPKPEEEPYKLPRVILATDLHYQSASCQDDGEAFQKLTADSDGKVIRYLPELLEAFIDQVIAEQPSALILSGDISMNGERINHEELAERLHRVREAGIPVLVIPGNHDINNTNASFYFGDEKSPAPSVTAEEFLEIYREYGYDQALSRDPASLSYVYALDEKNWLLMLDSSQYEPKNLVEGRIKEETLQWAREQLEAAREREIFVLPIAHHNLLPQSRMYTTQCVMENSGEVIDLLQAYELPLFLSGHLHVQRRRRHKEEPSVPDSAYGIEEIVTDALSIPPCQYGLLSWKEDGGLEYVTQMVDVSAWARRTGSQNPDLLDFEKWSCEYLRDLIKAQIRRQIKNLGETAESSMAAIYASVYMDYYAGREIDKEGVVQTKGYQWWLRNLPDSPLLKELDAMMADAKRDNNYALLPGI